MALLSSLEATMVIASHDLALVEALCDEAVVMAHGRVVRTGPTPQVLADEAFLRQCGM